MRDLQLSLFSSRDAEDVRRYLESRSSTRISLVITDNSVSMISARNAADGLRLRLHRIFCDAGDAVLDEVAAFLRNRRTATPLIRQYIRTNRLRISSAKATRPILKTDGRAHDLRQIFDMLNRDYFEGRISAAITWGRERPRRFCRRMTLGSYHSHGNIIRISPDLDRRTVPRYFVASVVYHEMLHADMGIDEAEGRRVVHSKEFRRREKLFREHDRAAAWERSRWGSGTFSSRCSG